MNNHVGNHLNSGAWAIPDEDLCPCRGGGWMLSPYDSWHQCPAHYNGQRYPEDYDEDEEEETS